jgi:threonine/homoserine/homoserine lactone efflux protein
MTDWFQALGVHSLGLFALTVLVLNATPGVDMLYVVSRTLTLGWRGGLAASLGISSGCVVHALLAAFGLAALLAVSAWAFSVLKWAGAAYLAWLGWGLLRQAWRRGGGRVDGEEAVRPAVSGGPRARPPAAEASAWALYRQGLLTNVLNPKVALFFLAFLPQFIVPGSAHKTAAFLLLGAWMVLQGTLFLFALVTLTAGLRRLGTPRGAGRWLNALGGGLFIALAARLAWARAPVMP